MRVCMIIPSFSAKGGIATVVSGYRGSDLEKEYDIHYIETYCDGGRLKKLIKAIEAYFKFLKEIIIWKPELVHIHSSFGASFYRKLPFVYLSSWLNIPIVNHIHGSSIDKLYTFASERKKKLVINNYKKCSKIIVLSKMWKDVFDEIIDANKIIVVENYSILHSANSKFKKSGKEVLFLGFLSKAKGCFDIPPIVKIVSTYVPDVKFILAGDGSKNDKKKLYDLVKEYKVENNIIFPGWVINEEKERLLEKSDLFFLPSYSEAMPMSILEAMGYGLPIVSTNVGGIPQLVRLNENGFLIKPKDINGFSEALIKLLLNNDLMEKMGKNSLKIVSEGYSLMRHINKIRYIYENI